MLTGAMIVWLVLAAPSLVFVIWDMATNTPVSWVQKLAWILVTLYTGPVGLVVFLLSCRSPGEGMHDAFTKPLWKQSVNSEMHCLAGDATGIVVAAAVLSAFTIEWWWELTIEYTAAYITGLFIFQAMMMRSMFSSYGQAVKRTIFVETVSMNMVMVGMIPTMILLAALWPQSMSPWNGSFWFRMGLACIAGALTAYPINHWLVSRGLKHGCMTVGMGHSAMGHDMPSTHHGEGDARPMDHAEMGHDMHHDHSGTTSMDHCDMKDGSMSMPTLPMSKQVGWVLATFAMLAASASITAWLRPMLT